MGIGVGADSNWLLTTNRSHRKGVHCLCNINHKTAKTIPHIEILEVGSERDRVSAIHHLDHVRDEPIDYTRVAPPHSFTFNLEAT